MEREPHFLDTHVRLLRESGELDAYQADTRPGMPWYNEEGDCVMCLTANEGVVADRIDEYLTLYRSAVDDRVIGFQVKGVQGLMAEFGYDRARIKAELEQDEVKAVLLLFASCAKVPAMNKRRLEGYTEAVARLHCPLPQVP